jgi:SulP family sulfate permease
VSILFVLAGVSRPHVAFLGRIPGTKRFSDLERNPDNESIPDTLIFRLESSLMYFNTEYILKMVMDKVRSQSNFISYVIRDLSTSAHVDLAGARMISALHEQLSSSGIALRLAEAHASVRDILRKVGIDQRVCEINRHISVNEIVETFQARTSL